MKKVHASLATIICFWACYSSLAAPAVDRKSTEKIKLGPYVCIEEFFQGDPSAEDLAKDEPARQKTIRERAHLMAFTLGFGNKPLLKRAVSDTNAYGGEVLGFIDPKTAQIKEYEASTKPVARDINGDGVPEIVVLQNGGGNCPSFQYSIISLNAKGPKEIFSVDNYGPITFAKGKANTYVIKIGDKNEGYSYWSCLSDAKAYCPHPDITLAWNGRAFVPSVQDMAKPRPSSSQLASIAAELRKEIQSQPDYRKIKNNVQIFDPTVLERMLDLIYSGNASSAHKLFELVYPGKMQIATLERKYNPNSEVLTKEQFWKIILDTVRKSQYISMLRQLNKGIL